MLLAIALFVPLLLFKASRSSASCPAGGSCGGETSSSTENIYSSASNSQWRQFLSAYHSNVSSYRPVNKSDCSCYAPTMTRDLAPWSTNSPGGGIQSDMIEAMLAANLGVLYQIIDHKLYRNKECMFPSRCEGVEYFLGQILPQIPDTEFVLNDRDYPQVPSAGDERPLPVFSFSKVSQSFHDILYPAWSFWAGGPALWPLYPTGLGRWDEHLVSLGAAAQQWPWEKKEPKAFFRGSRTSASRDPLVLLSRREPQLVDAQYTKNQAWRSLADSLGEEPVSDLPLADHCRYRYLFNFRGVAASFRFRHLFLCRSLVFHVGEDWTEFFYDALRPWVHYIPVRDDLSDVGQLLNFFKANEEVGRQIAERGSDFIRDHLRMADIVCYWRRLLRSYTRLLKYKVELRPGMIALS